LRTNDFFAVKAGFGRDFSRQEAKSRTMTDHSLIDAATRRLALALDTLEAALDRRLEADRGGAALSTQFHALGADRSRLASELDAETARARQLETTNREIARRLDSAIDNVRAVIDSRER
jgi:uncharacterized protein DUF4164